MSADSNLNQTNALTDMLYRTLKRHPKRIVFTDGEDIKVLRVAQRMVTMESGSPFYWATKRKSTKWRPMNPFP